jgi:DNA primase
MFNSQAILEYDELILVEAVTDAINLINAGYKNTISVSMTRLSDKHLELLKGKKLKVIFDKDYGGLQGLKDIKSRKREEELIYLSLLPMQKDFDELTEKEIHQVMEMIPNYNILGIIRDGGFLKDLLNIEKEWTKKK